MSFHHKGPVDALCGEIGFRYSKHLETPDIMIAYVLYLKERKRMSRAAVENAKMLSAHNRSPDYFSDAVLDYMDRLTTETCPNTTKTERE